MNSSKRNYLPKLSPPNTLRLRALVCKFWEDTSIYSRTQIITVSGSVFDIWLLTPFKLHRSLFLSVFDLPSSSESLSAAHLCLIRKFKSCKPGSLHWNLYPSPILQWPKPVSFPCSLKPFFGPAWEVLGSPQKSSYLSNASFHILFFLALYS